MDIYTITKKIPSPYFDYQKLKWAITGQTHERRFIGQLIKKGHIIRIKKGLYIWGEHVNTTPLAKEILANLIYGPSYISLEYALALHGIIPERVVTVTSVTVKTTKVFTTPVGTFNYDHLHKKCYPQGISLRFSSSGHSFLLADPEKSLLDTIALRFKRGDLSTDIHIILQEDLRIDLVAFDNINMDRLIKYSANYPHSMIKEFIKKVKNG